MTGKQGWTWSGDDLCNVSLSAASASLVLRYLILTKTLTCANDNFYKVFAAPSLTSSSNGENYTAFRFSAHPIVIQGCQNLAA